LRFVFFGCFAFFRIGNFYFLNTFSNIFHFFSYQMFKFVLCPASWFKLISLLASMSICSWLATKSLELCSNASIVHCVLSTNWWVGWNGNIKL
jgi:hypothetical protein